MHLSATAAINAAQENADSAASAAVAATASINDMASDSKLTPLEKQETKQKWDAIAGEKAKIDSQADTFGQSKTAYGNAYTALNTYLNAAGTGLLVNMTTTSDISGSYFRSIFTDYYNARQDLLNAISSRAKTLADTAQSTANNAQTRIDLLPTQITLAASSAQRNLLLESKLLYTSEPGATWFKEWGLSAKLLSNTKYTITIYGKSNITGADLRAYVHKDDWSWSGEYVSISENAMTLRSVTFTTPTNTLNLSCGLVNTNGIGTVYVEWVTLVRGDISVPEWSPSQDDPASVLRTAKMLIDALGFNIWGGMFHVNTDDFLIHTLSGGVDAMSIDDKGDANFKSLSAEKLYSPTVQAVYDGPAQAVWAGSINGTLANIAKHLPYDVTITIPPGTYYETVAPTGYTGKSLTFLCSIGANIVGNFLPKDNTAKVSMIGSIYSYGQIICTGTGAVADRCPGFTMQYMRITGKPRSSASDATPTGLNVNQSCGYSIKNSIFERTLYNAIAITGGSTGEIADCYGGQAGGDHTSLSNQTVGVYVGKGCIAALTGTIPYGNGAGVVEDGGYAPGAASVTMTPSPGTQPPAPTTRNLVYTLAASGTLKLADGRWGWRSTATIADAWQSNSDTYGQQIAMFVLNNAANIAANIGSGTFVSVKITLQRKTAYGDSGAVNFHLRPHNYATKAAIPTGSSTRPVLGSTIMDIPFGRGEQKTIDLPSYVFDGLKAGTIKGFGSLDSDPTCPMEGVCTLEIVVQGGP